jgi:TPR repeat protein
MNDLGVLYLQGRGVAKDEAEGARWYRKAADVGNADAMSRLGFLYEPGRGVAKDDAEAARWYRKAADGGSALAMRNLGALYDGGRGVPRDVAEAARWVFSAIEHGDAHTIEEMTNRSAAWSLEFRKALQDRLRQAGVYAGPSDGTFGPSVKDALAALAARAE